MYSVRDPRISPSIVNGDSPAKRKTGARPHDAFLALDSVLRYANYNHLHCVLLLRYHNVSTSQIMSKLELGHREYGNSRP